MPDLTACTCSILLVHCAAYHTFAVQAVQFVGRVLHYGCIAYLLSMECTRWHRYQTRTQSRSQCQLMIRSRQMGMNRLRCRALGQSKICHCSQTTSLMISFTIFLDKTRSTCS